MEKEILVYERLSHPENEDDDNILQVARTQYPKHKVKLVKKTKKKYIFEITKKIRKK